jgi:hypothetical protein
VPHLWLGVRAIDSPQTHLWISKAGLSFSVWNERARLETLELIGEQSAGLRSFALYHDEYRPDVLDRNVLNAIVAHSNSSKETSTDSTSI